MNAPNGPASSLVRHLIAQRQRVPKASLRDKQELPACRMCKRTLIVKDNNCLYKQHLKN